MLSLLDSLLQLGLGLRFLRLDSLSLGLDDGRAVVLFEQIDDSLHAKIDSFHYGIVSVHCLLVLGRDFGVFG